MNSYLKKKQIKKFDPNAVAQKGKLFGLPFTPETAEIVVIPVPWDVTTSFKDGASLGPSAILDVSSQIDLHIPHIPDSWKLGITMLPIDNEWLKKNNEARKYALQYIRYLEGGELKLEDKEIHIISKNINALSVNINDWVYAKSKEILDSDKIPVVLGGDHSSPYGLMRAIDENQSDFGVLHIDAHADLRPAYEGFTHSHASIMYNLLELDHVSKLVQIGIRDLCEQENEYIINDSRIRTFFDHNIKNQLFEGIRWSLIVDEIIDELPDNIYLSLDVDGLDPSLCPNSGTPVPGGLSFDQLTYLLDKIAESGKRIIAFDICEVAGNQGEWDAIVGSRLLYYLSIITGVSNKLLQMS
jgi:agmatinase